MEVGERLARRAIEDAGYIVHDANVLFHANCKNIDLVVYGRRSATYVQVKTSTKPAGKDFLVVDGSPWTEEQLSGEVPIYNKHEDAFVATFIVIVDMSHGPDDCRFYIFPPDAIEEVLRQRARELAAKPKRDGGTRSIRFRKELPRDELGQWENAWHLLEADRAMP